MASYNSKFITGDKLKPIIQDVYVEIKNTSTNASTEITNALNTAKTYAENKSTEALNSAKSYADSVGSSTLSSAKTYADNVGSDTLTAAKKYTDEEVSAALDSSTEYTDDEVAKSLAFAKTYADNVGSTTLSSAKTYADSVGSSTLSSAKSYADNVGSTTLSSAKSYTDTSITNLVNGAPTDANTLKKLNDRIDTNVQAISDLSDVVDTKATDADLTAHINDKNNPHSVTKAQVGLGNADNTADKDKNVLSATKLYTTRKIFNKSFDGTGDIYGQALVYGSYVSNAANRYNSSGLEIRENSLAGSTQSDIGYGPSIGFHWSGKTGGTLLMHNDGTFYLRKIDGTSRATLDANIVGNVTGNITGDVTGNITGNIKGNVTGDLTGTASHATNDSLGQKIDSTYIKALSVSGRVITYTRGDDTIGTITTQDTTYPVFTGATSSTAGTTGLVPAPGSGDNLKFLRADGNWVVPTDTNTWRPIEDVLTSTSTVNSLTANQGRVLKEYIDSNVTTLLGGASTDSNTLKKLNDKIIGLTNSSATDADLTAHKNDKSNPHYVTKAQVGLGNADNTADSVKDVRSATKLATARKIFSRTFDGTQNVEGQAWVYGYYTANSSTRDQNGGIQIRENGLVANTQSDIGYAPSIGFHWGECNGGTLLMHNDGTFYLKKIDGTSRATLDANIIGNVTGNTDSATKLATARTIQTNLASTSTASFDGSANITPGVTGVLAVANGGTGKTTGEDAANYLLNSLVVGPDNPTLSDYYISQYAGGGNTTTIYRRRPLSALWNTFNAEAAKVYLSLAGGTMTGPLKWTSESLPNTTSLEYIVGIDAFSSGGTMKWCRADNVTVGYATSAAACTGNSTTATKLTSSAGSATNPVYFSDGKPVACTYSLNKTVPADAKFTDTTYSAATSSAAGLMPAADKAKLDSIGDIITITKTLTITTEWQDTGISGTDLTSGSYIIQVCGLDSTATKTWNEKWTGFMSWYDGSTNSTKADEIVLHEAGHASNDRTIYLRTIRSSSTADNPYLRLQICASTDFDSTSVTFKFRKLI